VEPLLHTIGEPEGFTNKDIASG